MICLSQIYLNINHKYRNDDPLQTIRVSEYGDLFDMWISMKSDCKITWRKFELSFF